FERYEHPLFLSLLHNNYGIMFFNKGEYEEAKRHWEISLSFSSDTFTLQKMITTANLASAVRKMGDIRQAEVLLEYYLKLLKESKFYQYYYGYFYNVALLDLSKKDVDSAINNFKKSFIVSDPYPSKLIRSEMKRTFLREAKESGIEIESSIL
ncbi:MAG: tetratricopeptide repeat protein, partial [Thermoplasmatota archaeon]